MHQNMYFDAYSLNTLLYMYLSLRSKKGTKETLGALTSFAKQFYGSAQSSELGTFGVNTDFVIKLIVIINKRIYNPPVPQTALSLLLLHQDCLLIPLCSEPPLEKY